MTDLRGRGVGRRARAVHRPVRELALDLVTRAVLLDALGTLVELQPPAPRLRRAASRRRLRGERGAGRGRLLAEIAYYLDHHLEGSDPSGSSDLRDRCADEMRRALEHPRARPRHRAARRCWARSSSRPIRTSSRRCASCASAGMTVVIASNWDCSLPEWLGPPGSSSLVDGVVTSAEVGRGQAEPARVRAGARDRGRRAGGGAARGRQGRQRRRGRRGGRDPRRAARSARAIRRPGVESIRSLRELPALL